MTKNEYLAALRQGLSGLPKDDIERSIEYYSELIDDLVEEGRTEEEAMSEIGPVSDAVSQILSEISLAKIVKTKMKGESSFKTWEIVLLIIGAPLWLPLLLVAVGVALAMYVVIWSLIISAYSVSFSLAGGVVAGVFVAFSHLASGNIGGALCLAGAGLFCAGLFVLSLFACGLVAKGIVILSKKLITRIKSWFIRKESAK